jgi:hypothetical protein
VRGLWRADAGRLSRRRQRAVFLTVLHRLFAGGSDRAADRWREDYRINGVEGLDLHHLYRAMAWLGEELPASEQDDRTPFAPRCLKDVVEERLFASRRDLFSKLDLVFMDTTSLYFEGAGGETLGRRGYSKDHRPDLRQMISSGSPFAEIAASRLSASKNPSCPIGPTSANLVVISQTRTNWLRRLFFEVPIIPF